MDLNNNDLKRIFFALYYGQEVAFVPSYSDRNNLIKSKVFSFKEIEYLELKPLSKITDEDIKQWAYLLFKSEFKIIELYQNASDVWVIFNEIGVPFLIQPQDCNAMQIDYLRSKGYALPFMEYSIEDLVNIGWVKLTTSKK